jgi:DNA-binding NtrC family response regulator
VVPGRILIVDDETALLTVMQQYLSRLGYDVVACRSGQDAWRVFESDGGGFSLVLADVTMPDIPGQELLTRMLERNPDIAILICSGYPFDLPGFQSTVQAPVGFLQKPFTPRMLADEVGRLVKQRHPDGAEPS